MRSKETILNGHGRGRGAQAQGRGPGATGPLNPIQGTRGQDRVFCPENSL